MAVVMSGEAVVDLLRSLSDVIGTGEEPDGLCANRQEHQPHLHDSASLGRFWCTADQSQREPFRSERRRTESWSCAIHKPGQPCNSLCAGLNR